MELLRGRGISPGYAEGVAVVFEGDVERQIPRRRISDQEVGNEHRRFHAALTAARLDLERVEQRVLSEFGSGYAAIFSAHLALLHDPVFIRAVEDRVEKHRLNVEAAVSDVVGERAEQLFAVEDEYLRERAHDLRDVAKRIVVALMPLDGRPLRRLRSDAVVVARELLPSETIDLDRAHLVAIVTEHGGENSHAAILARSLGVPAVTGVQDATVTIRPGARLLVDGGRGEVRLGADPSESRRFAVRKRAYDDAQERERAESRPRASDERDLDVRLLANIGRADDAEMVGEYGMDGVGLFRTEYVFLRSARPPTFDEHYRVYQGVADALDGRPLTIRTLDLGGDKLPGFLVRGSDPNPGLSARGLRRSLAEHEMLLEQLRAIVSIDAPVRPEILFPMVFGADDLARAVDVVEAVTHDLGLTERPRVGAMIETPAALFTLDEILRTADFVSIGTNDLTQFLLAADRTTLGANDECAAFHPAVVRAVALVVERADAHGRPLTICGELAGDPKALPLLAGLGVRTLSMSPVRAPSVRSVLRRTTRDRAELLASRVLATDTAERVVAHLDGFVRDLAEDSRDS